MSHGQGKPQNGQGNVREKSGNFVRAHGWTPCSWMLMDIVVGLSVRPSVRLFVYGIFRWLCICWQITWNKWHKIWHDDVVIIGRWLLPSVVDTGDICCHYWQLILVEIYFRAKQEYPISHCPNDGCWWSNKGRRASTAVIDLVCLEYFRLDMGWNAHNRHPKPHPHRWALWYVLRIRSGDNA